MNKDNATTVDSSEYYDLRKLLDLKEFILSWPGVKKALFFSPPELNDKRKTYAWEKKLSNLSQIKKGMSWHKVFQILGVPDSTQFCPENIIQYTIDDNLRPKWESGLYIIISFDDNGKVVRVERVQAKYGSLSGYSAEVDECSNFVDWKKKIPEVREIDMGMFDGTSDYDYYRQFIEWKRRISNLPKIKKGMSWHKVIQILGNPRVIKYCPENVIQYAAYYAVIPKGENGSNILIFFDNNGKVIKIERSNDFYAGPPRK